MPSSAAIRIADPSDTTRCCPCPDQSGCDCNSGNCGIQCRTLGAFTASLCGFPEFSDADNPPAKPPRRYRGKTIKTPEGNPFHQALSPGNTDCNIDCQGVFCGHYNDFYPGIGFLIKIQGGIHGALYFDGVTDTPGGPVATYHADVTAFYVGGDPYPPGHDIPLECAVGVAGITDRLHTGDSVTLPVSSETRVTSLQVNYAGWIVVVTGCITPGKPPQVTIDDTWDYTAQYDKTTCFLSAADKSKRIINTGNCVEASVVDTPLPLGTPVDLYGVGQITARGDDSTAATSTGAGCIDSGDGNSIQYQPNLFNPIQEELSDEDTIDDAIARAMVGHDWSAAKSCDAGNAGTAFITQRGDEDTTFAFRQAQFRATVRDAIPHRTYNLTIGISSRAVGTTAPFTPYGEVNISFTASDVTPAVTPWQDLPCEEGLETQATSCNAVLSP